MTTESEESITDTNRKLWAKSHDGHICASRRQRISLLMIAGASIWAIPEFLTIVKLPRKCVTFSHMESPISSTWVSEYWEGKGRFMEYATALTMAAAWRIILTICQELFRQTWFFVVQLLFSLYNHFLRVKRTVPKATDPIILQSATKLASKIRSQELTSEQVLNAFISRIKEVNPLLNAVTEDRFEDALNEARNVDSQIKSGRAPPVDSAPFLGVPFTTKDAIFVNGMICTSGIPNRKNTRVFEDATTVSYMKKAGAIFLCVTNVSEVCMWWESNNTIYGRSNNPYDTRRICGGSSGGEGALISAGGSIFGIGSDIGGSIRMPCYFNGIFGHKPTGLVLSNKGTYPPVYGYQDNMQSTGPMCRYAEDLLPMLKVLAGPAVSKLQLDTPVDITKLRVFYMKEIKAGLLTPISDEMRTALKNVTKYLYDEHNMVTFQIDLPLVHYVLDFFFNDLAVPEAPSFTRDMVDLQGDINPFIEFVKCICQQSVHTAPALGLGMLERLMHKYGFSSPEHIEKALGIRKRLQREFTELLGDNGVLLFHSHATPAPYHNLPIFMPMNYIYTGLFNSLAMPASQVPLGLSKEGVPLGIQVVAAPFNDHLCLAMARELEKGFGGWVNFEK